MKIGTCIEHTDENIQDYLSNLDEIFNTISKCELKELDIKSLLKSPVCHKGFNRLN